MNSRLVLFLLFSIPTYLMGNPIEYRAVHQSHPKRLIHHLKVNPKRAKIELVNATGSCIGVDTVSNIAHQHGALLAVNGGNFQGIPMLGVADGPMKIDGEVCGYKKGEQGAIGWNHHGRFALIDRVKMSVSLSHQNRQLPVDAMNRRLYPSNCVIYSGNFHRTSGTEPGSKEAKISNGRLISLPNQNGNNTIPTHGYIYSVGKEAKTHLSHAMIDHPFKLNITFNPILNPEKKQQWQGFDHIVNGVVIVSNHSLIRDYHKEGVKSAVSEPRRARTAIGIDDNRWWHFVVVEDNHNGHVGMSMHELGQYMKNVANCRYAISLDGGGSSTLFYRNKKSQFLTHNQHSFMQENVFYHPKGGERPVGNAIIVK